MTFYRIAILLLVPLFRMAAVLGHRKATRAWNGRKGWANRLHAAEVRARSRGKTGPWFHLHCASLGEFEQGAPVLEQWRERHPDQPVLLTFFSPSGVEGVNPDVADHVDYLPFDTTLAMRRFVRTLSIADTVLVKYELWPELIRQLTRGGTRVHLAAARFDSGRHPLNALGFLVRRSMRALRTVQTQDAASSAALAHYGLSSTVGGDPRIDRVIATARMPIPGPVQVKLSAITGWAADRPIVVIGSAWQPEWRATLALQPHLHGACIVVAPHEVRASYVAEWASAPGVQLFSSMGPLPAAVDTAPATASGLESDILILDEIGVLKYAYQLGVLAIVGGGWGEGVHNTLEPAAFGIPVLCGPGTAGFREIAALVACGGARQCAHEAALVQHARYWLSEQGKRAAAGRAAAGWVAQQQGAAVRIVDTILPPFPSPLDPALK